MARQPRFQYAGAVYHVMARGDGGKQIFIQKEDYESFLDWLEKVCGSHGWRVHAWVLMGNHFHLLLETSEAIYNCRWTPATPCHRLHPSAPVPIRS